MIAIFSPYGKAITDTSFFCITNAVWTAQKLEWQRHFDSNIL